MNWSNVSLVLTPTVTSHEPQGVWNHRQLDCFSLFQQLVQGNITQNTITRHYCPLLGESTGNRWIPLTKGQWCRKRFHFVIMTSSWLSWVKCIISQPKESRQHSLVMTYKDRYITRLSVSCRIPHLTWQAKILYPPNSCLQFSTADSPYGCVFPASEILSIGAIVSPALLFLAGLAPRGLASLVWCTGCFLSNVSPILYLGLSSFTGLASLVRCDCFFLGNASPILNLGGLFSSTRLVSLVWCADCFLNKVSPILNLGGLFSSTVLVSLVWRAGCFLSKFSPSLNLGGLLSFTGLVFSFTGWVSLVGWDGCLLGNDSPILAPGLLSFTGLLPLVWCSNGRSKRKRRLLLCCGLATSCCADCFPDILWPFFCCRCLFRSCFLWPRLASFRAFLFASFLAFRLASLSAFLRLRRSSLLLARRSALFRCLSASACAASNCCLTALTWVAVALSWFALESWFTCMGLFSNIPRRTRLPLVMGASINILPGGAIVNFGACIGAGLMIFDTLSLLLLTNLTGRGRGVSPWPPAGH